MGKRNWYGCYNPDGEMCINSFLDNDEIEKMIEDIDNEDIDEFYSREFKNCDNESFKETIELNSTIMFCRGCGYECEFEKCKQYRESGKRRVIR